MILDPVQAGGPYNLTFVQRGSMIVLTDVLFGDVWLCSGQSNMAFTLGQVTAPYYCFVKKHGINQKGWLFWNTDKNF